MLNKTMFIKTFELEKKGSGVLKQSWRYAAQSTQHVQGKHAWTFLFVLMALAWQSDNNLECFAKQIIWQPSSLLVPFCSAFALPCSCAHTDVLRMTGITKIYMGQQGSRTPFLSLYL